MAVKLNSALVFIDDLLIKHSVSLRTVYDFAEQHGEELRKAGEIFELKSERDKKLCLSLFKLLAGKSAKKMSAYYCRRYGIEKGPDKEFFEENKLFLITAFIENPAFFNMSWNLCGIIQTRLSLKKAPVTIKKTADDEEWLPFGNMGFAFAASSGSFLETIFSESIDTNGIKGRLQVMANNENESGDVQFVFAFDEYSSRPPYFLVIRFKTVDGKSHTIKLDTYDSNEHSKTLIIQSELQRGIKYSGGFTDVRVRKEKNA
jgi:hypothetical protein